MPAPYFPLRWEGTGDQWWYASPIDFAAANGHFDLVRELLLLDPNLIIKLTSLRRIRRLETVWDDESQFSHVTKCRCQVAQKLLFESEGIRGRKSLLDSGYGGWLLYIAASAGDVNFVKELLIRKPLLVFGEGEYRISDMFYAASKSNNTDVFRVLFDLSMSRCEGKFMEVPSVFRFEMMNRAVHAAARGGNLEILKELLKDCSDVLVYRDLQGSSILHSASCCGQLEVVKDLVTSFDIIGSQDNQGHTALHIAAYSGHLAVIKPLVLSHPASTLITNNSGDTFFHLAVASFQSPCFRRLDRQKELMNQLVHGTIVDFQSVVNVQNSDGRTALHMAVTGPDCLNLVELLMKIPSIDLNIHDIDGMTPLDLLVQQPRSPASEILIKKLVSAGGVSNIHSSSSSTSTRSTISPSKVQGVVITNPGTSFRINDSEMLSYMGTRESEKIRSSSSVESSEIEPVIENTTSKKQDSANSSRRHLKVLLKWHPQQKEKKQHESEEPNTPKTSTLVNNKRVLSIRSVLPSSSTKKKFSQELMHGVIQATPQQLTPSIQSPSGSCSISSMSSSSSTLSSGDKDPAIDMANGDSKPGFLRSSLDDSMSSDKTRNSISINKKLMNQYFCFGTQDLAVDEPARTVQANQVIG